MSDICVPAGTDWSCLFPTEAAYDAARADVATSAQMDVAEAFAWSLLASLTGYRIGTCPLTIRPCAARCAPPNTWLIAPVSRSSLSALSPVRIGMFNPYISGGVWYNACGCGQRASDCSCGPVPTVVLPGPVGKIEEILIDGVVLDPTAYRVDNGTLLVRTDGGDWPLCQDMAKPTVDYDPITVTGPAGTMVITRVGQTVTIVATSTVTPTAGTVQTIPWPSAGQIQSDNPSARSTVTVKADGEVQLWNTAVPVVETWTTIYETSAPPASPDLSGTFEVTYYRGAAPNSMTKAAAGALAAEFFKACKGDECRLPSNLTRASRGGEVYEFSPMDFPEGDTGGAFPQVDAVIRIYNPNRLTSEVQMASPETLGIGGRVTTWQRR